MLVELCRLVYSVARGDDFKVDGRERIKGSAGMVEGEDGEG